MLHYLICLIIPQHVSERKYIFLFTIPSSRVTIGTFYKQEFAVKKVYAAVADYFRRSDMLLLFLCIAATVYGIILIDSATRYLGAGSYTVIQTLSLFIGIFLYVIFSIIDVEIIADKWRLLFLFDVLFISSLFIFGEAGDSGNNAWIRFGSIGIQPAEVVKVPYIILLAKQLEYCRERRGINHFNSLAFMAVHFFLMFALIIVSSSDLGSALVYAFIFAVMLYAGGVKLYWFGIAIAAIGAAIPFLWNHFLADYQKERIIAPYDPSIDPTGLGITWQANQSKAAIASGEFFGKGLFQGDRTQSGSVPQQQTDFIFAVAGEELGFVGCMTIVILLSLIIIRCIMVGLRSNNRMGMTICFGIAAMLTFQMLENVGMCLGLTPVIGLTLPFFSYGGSSIITLFAAMGIVSGIRMHRNPQIFWMGNIS